MHAKQGGKHPASSENTDAWGWAHKSVDSLPQWRKSECTGVHAEMLIVRAWVIQLVLNQRLSVAEALTRLKGRHIEASQPACVCCAAFMRHYGIGFPDEGKSNVPGTGWRHPLAVPAKTLSNDTLRGMREITFDALNRASGVDYE